MFFFRIRYMRIWGSSVSTVSGRRRTCYSVPDNIKIFLCSSKGPDIFWGPNILLLERYQEGFSVVKRKEREADHLPQSSTVIPWLRMSGSVPQLPHKPVWRVLGHLPLLLTAHKIVDKRVIWWVEVSDRLLWWVTWEHLWAKSEGQSDLISKIAHFSWGGGLSWNKCR
jgi:hypothetical protein